MPLHIKNKDGSGGMLRRQCTKEYKVRPIQRLLRVLGATRKAPVELLIGISLDEIQRMKDSRVQYVEHSYPLVDRRMSRNDCTVWLERHGYEKPPKSACIGCPFMDNGRWRTLKASGGPEWADAVDFDASVRHMSRIDGGVYLHRSLLPLPMVDLSRPQDHGQVEMFGAECTGMCGV
jgi:hypothetical protein